MNDQFDVNGGVSEMAVSRQPVEHLEAAVVYAACTETVAQQHLAQSNETTEDQTGGNDTLSVKQSSWRGSTINAFPGCYDDDYYGSVQLI